MQPQLAVHLESVIDIPLFTCIMCVWGLDKWGGGEGGVGAMAWLELVVGVASPKMTH